MVGVSWASPTARPTGAVEVRTRGSESGRWGDWRALEVPDTPMDFARGATEPLWVGPSNGVQARVGGRPAGGGLRLDLVDPGTTSEAASTASTVAAADPVAYAAETATPTPTATSVTGPRCLTGLTTAPTKPPAGKVPRPPMVTRAQWGADETIVQCPTVYSPAVKAVIVHHEAGTNTYSCTQSAAMIRSIQAYHVKTQGWGDIGYNFVVDKCGRIFEGSKGGADLPVKARHTLGFNPDTVGISLLGNMETAKPTRAARAAIARIAGWKLGQYGADPLSRTTLTAEFDNGKYTAGQQVEVDRIISHRDVMATACPGANLYTQLPKLRTAAAGPTASAAPATADVNRDGTADLTAGTPKASGGGSVTVLPGSPNGPATAAKKTVGQASAGVPGSAETGDDFGTATAWGDVNADGYADLAIGAPGEDDTTGHTDAGAVTVLYGPSLTSGTTHSIPSASRTSGARLGTKVALADFNADGRADVLALAPGGTGRWWHFDSATAAAVSGPSGLTRNGVTTGDFNADGYPDAALNYRDTTGHDTVRPLYGSANGPKPTTGVLLTGAGAVAAGDLNGDGFDDLVIGDPYTDEATARTDGKVQALYGSATGLSTTRVTTITQSTTGVPGAAEAGDKMGTSVAVGDFDLDGFADVLTGLPGEDVTRDSIARTDAGTVLLLKGSATGLTGTGSVSYTQDSAGIPGSTEAGDQFGTAVSLADVTGTTRADRIFGAGGEDAGDGAIQYLNSSGTGTHYSRTTLGTQTATRLGQNLAP
ncbi:FG-GAP-like repeat-containing protein [Streptomyces atratus]|uniref:FG-GAP-like repeat-containing protein n=1 Tax=Streptomyces atratus TaxID=1893 RepID=UPI0033CE6CFD